MQVLLTARNPDDPISIFRDNRGRGVWARFAAFGRGSRRLGAVRGVWARFAAFGRYRARQATAPRRNVAKLSRHCRISVALGIWGGRYLFPIFAWRTKEKPRLRNSFTASEALSAKRGNDTCPYIPAWLISLQLSALPWDPPLADSTSPYAAAWDRWGKTARSALGAPSNSAGSRSDSR